jgi:Flp pilus assembly protein TadD
MTHMARRALAFLQRALPAVIACAIITSASGCSVVRDYRSRVGAEDAFADGARAAERGDLATADRSFARALRLESDSASLRARIGMAYMRMEPPRPDRALPHLRRSLEVNPNQPFVVYQDAILAAAQLGRDSWARQVVRRAYRRFYDDALALNDIGYLLADADKLTREALPLIERAVELEPKSGTIIDSLGWEHYRLGDQRRAAGLLERACELAPDDAEIEYHLGVIYADLGRSEDARRQFRRALDLAPGFAPAAAALRALDER